MQTGRTARCCCIFSRGIAVALLDGDEVRKGLSSDLGYTDQDRSENFKRVAHVARLMVDAELMVIVILISSSRRDRLSAKTCIDPNRFSGVFVDAPLSVRNSGT
ncbi:adenylyl-sulfate kinase [Xanthomonas pisi]|uniref:Adenylyl-sulfate kinase n=1 Tax=Xanthomonas pisi TaxID=56457 RepID=A0A2S7D5R0_9XANT|nr:adenylyl-sulfate kinase [Xanthomonas pisi]